MLQRGSFFYVLVGLGSFFLLFLMLNERFGSHLVHQMQPAAAAPNTKQKKIVPKAQPAKIEKPVQVLLLPDIAGVKKKREPASSEKILAQIISTQRKLISNEMKGYEYPDGKYNISANKLDDLVMEKNGRPVRSLIVTTWRSGSTFFGDILNAHPANYYHYEPLLAFEIVQVRGPLLAAKALKWVKDLLNCEYQDLGEYIDYGKPHPWVFNHNTNLWKQCQAHKGVCYNHKFLSSMCKLFPFQSMKLVRLRLRIAQELLADEKLAVRMVLLVRDPRGILQSRKHRDWCPSSPDCSEPALTCTDLVSDYKVAVELLKKYPTRFKVIRYEDLSLDPYKHVEELYKFYGLNLHQKTKKFLESHTKANKGGVSSTFRNSATAPFHWRTELEFEEVEEIQQFCSTAMKYWGYVPATNATHQKEFNPVTNYTLIL